MPDDGNNEGSEGGRDDAQGNDAGQEKDTWNGENFDAEKAKELVSTLRKESRSYKSELARAQAALKAREDAEKTELEKAQSKLAELEGELTGYKQRERDAALRRQVADVATKLGAHYPEDMYALVQGELDVADDGKVRNAEAAIKSLKESRPALFREVKSPPPFLRSGAQSGDGDNFSGDMNALIRQRAGVR